jgi:putative tricarboxylic transport membrane protein
MQRIHQAAALSFLLFSALVMWASWGMDYYTKLGPGSGFFPFWLGISTGVLSFIWLIQVSLRSGRPKDAAFLPERTGIGRILAILAALATMAALMDLLGFQIMMFALIFFLLMVLGEQKLWVTLVIALVGSVGVYHVFSRYLDVQLPAAAVKFLAHLGL